VTFALRGSLLAIVAPTFEPLTLTFVPLSTAALLNRSLSEADNVPSPLPFPLPSPLPLPEPDGPTMFSVIFPR